MTLAENPRAAHKNLVFNRRGKMVNTPPNPVDNPAGNVNPRAIMKFFWPIFKGPHFG